MHFTLFYYIVYLCIISHINFAVQLRKLIMPPLTPTGPWPVISYLFSFSREVVARLACQTSRQDKPGLCLK